MKLLKDYYSDSLSQLHETGNQQKIVKQESYVTKKLYEHLDRYVEEEADRTQKIK